MLICVTGLDGCGKGTQISFLKKYLEKKGKMVFYSKAYTNDIKETFSLYLEYWEPIARMFFFQSLFVQQRKEVMEALKQEQIVIADRWDESYIAYHSQYGELAEDNGLREQLHQLAFKGLLPDITFFIDIPAEMVRQRTELRGQDFFDKGSLEYHSKMREGYLKLAKERSWITIDGTRTVRAVHRIITSEIEKYI